MTKINLEVLSPGNRNIIFSLETATTDARTDLNDARAHHLGGRKINS